MASAYFSKHVLHFSMTSFLLSGHADIYILSYLFKREREDEQEGEEKRIWESEADSTMSTEPDMGVNLTSLRSGHELKSSRMTNWLNHPHTPLKNFTE